MRSYLWWLLPYVLFFTFQPFADPSSEEEPCYTDHLHEQLLATDTAYRQQWEEIEQETYRKLSVSPLKSGGEVCVLPVVFHIVHQNGSENLTDAQIQQALTQLNAAFANTGYYDQGTGVDTDIQFCLARRDPEGNPTNGINRIVSPLTNLDADNDDLNLKNLSRWAPHDYINIWVVRDICGLGAGCNVLGYAYYPSAHGTRRDGLVVEAAGLTGDEVGITTTVHEIGHYLGLYHTFEGGCVNNDCLRDGDRVCDTPPDNSRAAIPCTGTANSCSTDANSGLSTDHNDMFNNYMDYGHARCYNAFTAGQRERMHHFLEGRRRSLLESKGCLEPCMNRLMANFSGLPTNLNVGSSVSLQNESVNADTYSWTINGEAFSTLLDPAYTFTQTGSFTIELTVSSDDPACELASFSQMVIVECPFGADFSAQLGEDSFFPGDTLRLTAPDNTATYWEWSLNGVQVGTAAELVLEVPNDFPLELCLELGDMYCTATYCESLNLVIPPATCLEGSFAKRYNFYSQADILLPNTTSANGGYYLIGNTVFNSEPWPIISRLSAEGEVLSSDRLSMEFPTAYRAIQITGASLSGSRIHLSGFISGNVVEPRAVAFYYDPAARESFGWTIGPENSTGQAISSAALNQFSSIWSYTNWQTGSFNIGLKRAISFPTPFPRYTHSAGTLDIFSVRPTSDYILAAGHLTNQANANTGQAIVLAFDRNDYSQYTTWHRALNAPAEGRFIIRDIATTATKWAAIYTDETSRGSDFYFARATLADTTTRCDWAYNYDLPELGDQVVEEVITLPDGYLIYGQATSGDRECFLIRTDFNGELRWAKAYDFGSSEVLRPRVSGNLRIAQRSFVFLAKHGDRVLIAKVNEDGEFLEDCYSVRDLEVVRQPAPTQLYPLLINEETGTITASTERLPATSLALAVLQETCEPLCETTEICERPYLTRYESTGDSTTVFNCIAENAQQTWVGGSVHDNTMSVSAIDQGGYPKWTTVLSGWGVVQDLAMGQDGFLYGVGIDENIYAPIRYPVYFKLHPLTGRPAWVYSFSESSTRPTALAELPDGRWVGVGETYSGGEGCNGWLFFFDPNGNLLGSEQYDIGTCETWRDVVVDTEREQILVYGRVNLRRGGDAGLRPGLAAFSFAGDLLWSKYYGVNNQRNAIMEGHFLLLEGDRRWLLSTENGIGIGPGIINLTYTNVEGVPLRQHTYYLPEGVKGSSIAHTANGSKLILARPYQTSKPGAYLFQIDAAGEVQWAKYYPSYKFPKRARNLIRAGNTQITLIGQTEDIQGTPLGTIISLNPDGTTIAECLPWEEVEVERREGSGFVAPLELSHRELPGRTTAEEAAASLLSVHHSSCWQDCEVVEICDNGQDDDGDNLIDCDDQDLVNTCCCLPPEVLSLGPDTLICSGGPLTLAPLPGPWRFFHWSDGSRADSLTVYEAGTYHLEAIDSCGRIGRDTLTVFARELPLLDLGPDTTLCANAVVPIEAGPDFESYRWVTGSTEPRITAYQAGAYWVEATDSCGQVQHDTLVVHIDPATEIELGRDTLICPGDTLVLSLSGFQRYQWSRSSYLSCDSCALVRFAPTQDTLLLVAAEQGPGCISSDSLRVRVLDPMGSRQQMLLCPGDSVSFFGQTLKEAGQYYHVQQAANCSRTDTLDLAIFTDTLQLDSLRLCAGDSILVFDRYEREAGTYEEVYQSVLGCDSISRVVVEMFPSVLTTDSLRLCAGDSVWLFNNYVRETAWYEATFQTLEGCDSTHRVYVQFDSLELNLTQIRTACAQAAVGELQATVTGGMPPYDFRWSTGAAGAQLQGLAAGTYTLTVSDVNGCAATGTIAVEHSPLAAFSVEVLPERCPDAADGQLWLSAQSDDLLFRIDGSPFRTDTIWTGLAVGEHLLQVRDAADCTDSLSFRVAAARPLVLELPAQISVALGDSVHLQPLHNQGDSARLDWWWPVEQSCLDCPELSLLPLQTMDVQVLLMTRDSCTLDGQTRIYVDERQIAYVPNAFSPNGDGVNDHFWLYPTSAVRTLRQLQIFDRWGGLAYAIKDADPTDIASAWDGRVKGQDCNAGVFVYTLILELVNGEVVVLNGELVLLR